jgi:hypothetical protein
LIAGLSNKSKSNNIQFKANEARSACYNDRMKLNNHQAAVLKTVIYAAIFDYPLTRSEIHARLIHPVATSKHQTNAAIDQLTTTGHISEASGYYFLAGKDHTVTTRKRRLKSSTAKYLKAAALAKKLAHIPGVKAIFLTGAVTCDNAEADDDIDLMIITASNSLWTTRFLITAYLELKGIRRRPNQTFVKDLMCPNLYLAESALRLPQAHQNVYTANEICLAKPLYDPNNLSDQFKTANKWLIRFLANTPVSGKGKIKKQSTINSGLLETISFQLQRAYMASKITRETIEPNRAHFHPQDTGGRILHAYQKELTNHDLSYP